jgi:hypothetical protein
MEVQGGGEPVLCLHWSVSKNCREHTTRHTANPTQVTRLGPSLFQLKEIESRDIILFLKDLFEKIIVLSVTAYGFKICKLCRH